MADHTDRAGARLPVQATGLVGRERELAEIKRLCAVSPLVTVVGVGGVGKTRLAVHAAHELRTGFADGVRWVELSALRDGDLLGHAVAKALRVADQTARPVMEVLVDHLADKDMLLVLDTCEHILKACAELAELLRRSAPGLRILATSRQPIGIGDEQTSAILPFPVADPGLPPSVIARQDAVKLFAERAAIVDPDFALTERNLRTVAGLCRRLDGIPLAIELAAGWLSTLPLEDLVVRLDDRFQLPIDEAAVPFRHRRLRTTVGWSHELCAGQERLMWARLSVFAGTFDLAAAEQVCGDHHLPRERIAGLMAALVDKSILQRRDDDAGVRYRLLDTLRQYGAEWLHALGEETWLRLRHRDWFLCLAEREESRWFGAEQAATFARTQREDDNLRAALEFSLATAGQMEKGLHLAATLWFYWVGCGQLAEGRHWLDRALSYTVDPAPARAKGLWVNGYIALLQGDSASAVPMLEDCLDQAQRTGDRRAQAYARHRLGCAALLGDDHAGAAPQFGQALALYAELGELNSNVIMARVELAMISAFEGDLVTAVDMCEAVRRTCEQYGERWAKAYALYVLAFAAWVRGDADQATGLAREALRINHTFHDFIGIVLPIELLALFRTARGHHRQAAVLQGAAHQIWRAVGPPLFGSAYFNAPHAECEARIRGALGDHAYESAFQHGTRLDIDQTVAHALSDAQEFSEPTASGR